MDNHAGEISYSGFPVDVAEQTVQLDRWQAFENAIARGAKHPRRALAIVGSHPEGLENVPWDDESIEIWVFNEAPLKPEKFHRWNAVIQIHGQEVYSSPTNWVNHEYWPWLQQRRGKRSECQTAQANPSRQQPHRLLSARLQRQNPHR
jgi:hypothetical protein